MGNALSPCFLPIPNPHPRPMVKLIFWGGTTQLLHQNLLAGEVLFKNPDRIICHADSFYIGHPIPTLSIEDELIVGNTYFVLPVDCFPCRNLTTSSLASLSSSAMKNKEKKNLVNSKPFPFEHVKLSDGRIVIKVLPEFILRVICGVDQEGADVNYVNDLCSTAELRKHYKQLVGSRDRQPWSPKLETITELSNFKTSANSL